MGLLHGDLHHWILEHGSLGLFILLSLGIVGLPIPDETLIILAGLLCAKGKLPLVQSFFAILLGSMSGITVSYLLGYFAGQRLLKQYGYWVGITTDKIEKVHQWFERAGKWVLTFGYFLPGVRHLSGFISGAAYLRYITFAFFAYFGAVLWCSTFFCIGYYFYGLWANTNLHNLFV